MLVNTIRNTQANALHVVLDNMLHTARLEARNEIDPKDIVQFILDTAWAVCSIHHNILGSSTATAVFGQDILFKIPHPAAGRQLDSSINRWPTMQMLKIR